jgi:hypothetical protein
VTEAKEKKQKISISKNAVVILLTIILLVAITVFVYKYLPKSQKQAELTYNNFEFNKQPDGMWHTRWQRDKQVYDVSLRYSPLEVQNVSVQGGLNETFFIQPFYLTFDPDSNSSNSSNNTDFKYLALAFSEIGLNVVRGMGGQVETACTKNISEVCEDHPIVTCDDDKAVFYMRIAPEPRVILGGNCLILEGNEFELIKAVDRVLYHFYQIMP